MRSPTESRHHPMPFGAEAMPDGRIRFRLWAPDAKGVELCIEDVPDDDPSDVALTLAAEQNGWFGLITEHAHAGTLYRYRIDGDLKVPDPASRYQPEGVHGPSQVVDSRLFEWQDLRWPGRPWEEAVVYELHIGTFTPEGTFAGAARRLPYLAELGVTALEVMPISSFPGHRNWGYDGVLPFAPQATYGTPDDVRAFVQAAHAHGLMVLLDVVYNHFGPEGNYLHAYARDFFTDRHQTPWGQAINYDGRNSRTVRSFFIHNALYWLDEFRFDGLRLDAVHAIKDDSEPDLLEELAAAVGRGPGRERQVHLVVENYDNQARYLRRDDRGRPGAYAAQWNDDFHHACHVLLTDERDAYYADYAGRAVAHLERCLAEGFAYQGELSEYIGGAPRGERSKDLPPTAFIAFLQNHDQVGNRVLGERLVNLAEPHALRAMTSILLLSPAIPALFMGEEFGCRQPFYYFADFDGELAEAVREGRLREHAASAAGIDPSEIPDPCGDAAFADSVLDWQRARSGDHQSWLELYTKLLGLRQRLIVPRLDQVEVEQRQLFEPTGLALRWRLADGAQLSLLANLGDAPAPVEGVVLPAGRVIHSEPEGPAGETWGGPLQPWSVIWHLHGPGDQS